MSREMKDSGVEWIGEIPESWDVIPNKHLMKKVKDLCPVYNGEDILSLSMKGVYVRDPNDESGKRPATYNGYQYVQDGDLLMCLFDIDVTPRCVGRVYNNGLTSPAYSRFVMNKSRATVDYYYYYYLALDFDKTLLHLSKNMRSSLTESDFGSINAPVPLLTEQSQIVHFLDRKCTAIDTAIEKTKKSIEKLEEYKKAVITKAVTKGIDPNAKMKDSGVEWIGEIPEGWKVTKTKYLFRILKRIAGREGFDVISITQKGLKIKDITSNEGQVAENYSNYQFVFPGDFAMNHMDLLTGWVDFSTLTGVTSPDYRVFHKINESVNDDYYKSVFQSLYFNKVYYGLAQGVAEVGRKRLQAPAFKELKLPCPPSDEPAKIAAYIKGKCMTIDALIEKKQTAINKWEEYKKSLIYYAVTGKIDCRNEVI